MRNHTAPSTANEDVASLYYGTVHACFFRQHESSSCIFLEDCENAQDAMGRLATQQAHIDSKIGSFAETEGRLLVDAVLDVCSIRQGYSILLRGLEDARNKVCSTKSVLSTMPRDVRGLLFELCLFRVPETNLGVQELRKHCGTIIRGTAFRRGNRNCTSKFEICEP